MTFNKITAIGTVLFNLAMPVCAKMYNPGLETRMEQKYNVDLVGNFCDKELKKISKVMKSIDDKIDRKKAGIETFTIENVEYLKEKMMEEDRKAAEEEGYVFEADLTQYADAEAKPEKNLIRIDSRAINDKINQKKNTPESRLMGYDYMLPHEIGHLVYDKHSKKIFFKFWDYNIHRDSDKKGELPDGYVTPYPIQRVFFVRTNEDFADIFSYWINNKHYADNDSIVQKKIDAVKGYTRK
jgi:hypothetical protein